MIRHLVNAVLNKKKYEGLSWFENFMGGHIDIFNVTIFGENAMHWGVTVHTKRYGYICFRLPFRCFGVWYKLYFYCSPDGTPGKATYIYGVNKCQ